MTNASGDEGRSSYRARLLREFRSSPLASLSSVASSVALGAAVFGLVSLVSSQGLMKAGEQGFGPRTDAALRSRRDAQVVQRLGQLQADITALQRQQAALSNLPASGSNVVQLSSVSARLETVERRLGALEQAILASPEKAIALPLIRRDIDSIRESQTQSVASLKQTVDQVYDLTKWLLGVT